MSYTSAKRPAGRPGSSTGAVSGLAQNKGSSTEKSSLKAKSHDLAPRVHAEGRAVGEIRQCAEINQRALAAGPKRGVVEPGCGNLLATEDLAGLTYVVRPSFSELDHHVLHLRWRLGRGCDQSPFRYLSSCGNARPQCG